MKRLATLITFFGFLFVFAPASEAHTELMNTSPSAGSTIDAPTSIELNFSEVPLLEGSAIVVHDQAGIELATGELSLNETSLNLPWPEDAQPGKLLVSWRAVDDDGHVLNGQFDFEYSAAAISQMQGPPIEATPLSVQPRGQTPVEKQIDAPRKLNVIGLGIGISLLLVATVVAAISSRRP
jgi:methionine-rich copper-binding protein CopC